MGCDAMTVNWGALIGVGTLLLALSSPGAAHHGQAGLFDQTRMMELKGAVKQWSFVNPHPILLLEVADEKGAKADWDVYFGPSAVSALRRQGFTPETFRIGEAVVVKGYPATGAGVRGIDVWGKGTSVTRADGKAVP
jgi:hypothetical protein